MSARTRRPAARRAVVALTAAGLVTGGMLAGAGQAQAKGSTAVVTSGACTKGGTYKLKAKPENGRIQAEVEIEGRSGQVWRVVVVDNKVVRVNTSVKTVLGQAKVTRLVPNMAGVDTISLRATNTATGSVCSGAVRL